MALATQVLGVPGVGNAVGTVPVKWTHTFSWTGASAHAAQTMDIALDLNSDAVDQSPAKVYGDFWLVLQETAGTPVAEDDVDIQIQPLARYADGTLGVTQQAAVDIENAVDFDNGTGSRMQAYSLNAFFSLSGTAALFLGGDGFRITADPAANATITLVATVIAR